MFIGHYGVSLAARPLERRVPLWVWFVAAQWLDVVWSVLVLAGVEKVRLVPRFTQANSYDLYYMPYTHSLPGAVVLSLAFGGFVALFVPVRRLPVLLTVAAAAFSHWLLDLIVHVPDLPLYGDSAKVGFGLWRHIVLSFPLELIVLGLGAWLYARNAVFVRSAAVFWAFVIVLAALQAYVDFVLSPPSPQVFAMTALGLYALLAAFAAVVERFTTGPVRAETAA